MIDNLLKTYWDLILTQGSPLKSLTISKWCLWLCFTINPVCCTTVLTWWQCWVVMGGRGGQSVYPATAPLHPLRAESALAQWTSLHTAGQTCCVYCWERDKIKQVLIFIPTLFWDECTRQSEDLCQLRMSQEQTFPSAATVNKRKH